ncbi:MAG: hypothetical protein PVG22_14650 [Chromatiales bacterium]|jgi:hypothetical protein
MLLLIKHIPGYITKKELTTFIRSTRSMVWRLFPVFGGFSLEKCQILRIEDKQKQTVEYHCLVSVEPEKSCQVLLKKLNGALMFGRPVEVKPYAKRSPYKDRRRSHADLELLKVERRRNDRRRTFLSTRIFDCRNA